MKCFQSDFSEATLPIWEGVATAAQKWTLGEEGYWAEGVVATFQEMPRAPTVTGDSSELWYRDEDALGAPSANFSDVAEVTFL